MYAQNVVFWDLVVDYDSPTLTLKMEVAYFSETLISSYSTKLSAWREWMSSLHVHTQYSTTVTMQKTTLRSREGYHPYGLQIKS
jgi:hypothetical protein